SRDGGDIGERAGACLPVPYIEKRRTALVDAVGAMRGLQGDEAVGLTKRQRPNGHSIDHAEDGAIDADAEGQADDGEERHSWLFGEGPKCVPDVLKEGIHTAV